MWRLVSHAVEVRASEQIAEDGSDEGWVEKGWQDELPWCHAVAGVYAARRSRPSEVVQS
jgi:hypothetical protein